MRGQLLAAAGLGLSLMLCGAAPPAARDSQVARGLRQYSEGNLDGALETLVAAARRLSSEPTARDDLALVNLYCGLAYADLDQEKAARASFREALSLRPDLTLDAERFSRRALRLFEQARAEREPAPADPAAPPVAAAPWAAALRAVVQVPAAGGPGCSGVALGATEVLTGTTCVTGDAAELKLAGGRSARARVAGRDPDTALALLRVDAEALSALEIGEGALETGAPVTALVRGPMGERAVSGRVTGIAPGPEGVVYQTDLVLTPGEGFGALLDAQGRLAGMTIVAEGPPGSKPLAFAYSAGVLRYVYDGLRAGGRVARGWLGITIRDVDDELARKHGLGRARGALVTEVDPFGPASLAGFRVQDILVAVEGGPGLASSSEATGAVSALKPGSQQAFLVYRPSKKKYIWLKATVADRPARPTPLP